MCWNSVEAEMSRPATRGEHLVVTRAPHGLGNWLTKAGHPAIAVCIPHGTLLSIEVASDVVRSARFEQNDAIHDHMADEVVYVDGSGNNEREFFSCLEPGYKVQVMMFAGDLEPYVARRPAVLLEERELAGVA